MTAKKRSGRPLSREQVVEFLKERCVETLKIGSTSEMDEKLGASLAITMLEAVAPSVIRFSAPLGGYAFFQNSDVRAPHALDLLNRITAIQWQPRTPTPTELDKIIFGAVPHTKRVLWAALWHGYSSDDREVAKTFAHALLDVRCDHAEESKVFKEMLGFDYFRHEREWLHTIIRTAPSVGNNIALDRMIKGLTRRLETHTELCDFYFPETHSTASG